MTIPRQRLPNQPFAASDTKTGHSVNLTPIDRPDTWIAWCGCGWEYEGSWDLVFRERTLHVGQRLSAD